MIGFLVGVLLSVVAAAPALLLLFGAQRGEMKQVLKLWAIGLAIRFGIIGAGLYYLFTETAIARIPTVLGVALAYFALFIFEARSAFRSSSKE